MYNFTIFNQASFDGYCVAWNENEGERGANEIGTLLFIYLRDQVPQTDKHVVITSNTITGSQNRNRYIISLCHCRDAFSSPGVAELTNYRTRSHGNGGGFDALSN